MKKWLVPLLIGLMFVGLTLLVLAAERDTRVVNTITSADVFGTTAKAPTAFLRRLVCGICGLLVAYTQLGFTFSKTGSRVRNASIPMSVNIAIHSIGMLACRVRLFLISTFLIPRTNEQKEVCYG